MALALEVEYPKLLLDKVALLQFSIHFINRSVVFQVVIELFGQRTISDLGPMLLLHFRIEVPLGWARYRIGLASQLGARRVLFLRCVRLRVVHALILIVMLQHVQRLLHRLSFDLREVADADNAADQRGALALARHESLDDEDLPLMQVHYLFDDRGREEYLLCGVVRVFAVHFQDRDGPELALHDILIDLVVKVEVCLVVEAVGDLGNAD